MFDEELRFTQVELAITRGRCELVWVDILPGMLKKNAVRIQGGFRLGSGGRRGSEFAGGGGRGFGFRVSGFGFRV